MIRTIALATLSAVALTAGVSAQDRTVDLSIGYDRVDFDGLEFDAVSLRGGYNFTENFAVEGQASFGLSDETVGGVDVELNHSFGVFGVARAPFNEGQSAVFGRIGYTTNEIEASAGGFSAAGDDEAWAFGVGGEHFFNGGAHGVRADYTRFEFDEGGDADAFGLSYVYRFGAN